MPLLHSTSRVSSPEGLGNVPGTTWTFSILLSDWGTPLACQNATHGNKHRDAALAERLFLGGARAPAKAFSRICHWTSRQRISSAFRRVIHVVVAAGRSPPRKAESGPLCS